KKDGGSPVLAGAFACDAARTRLCRAQEPRQAVGRGGGRAGTLRLSQDGRGASSRLILIKPRVMPRTVIGAVVIISGIFGILVRWWPGQLVRLIADLKTARDTAVTWPATIALNQSENMVNRGLLRFEHPAVSHGQGRQGCGRRA